MRRTVDWSSVEVFAQGGRALMADQIFPKPSSSGLAAWPLSDRSDSSRGTVIALRHGEVGMSPA